MNFEIKDGKVYLSDEEDIYGVNESEENEYDSEFWMPFERSLRSRKRRLRVLAGLVILAFVAAFALYEFRSVFGW